MVHIPATILSEKAGRRREGEQNTKEQESENQCSGTSWVFWVCLENRDWDEARACSLTSMDRSLGSMPAKCVHECVCVLLWMCVYFCECLSVCLMHKQWSNHDLHIKVEVFDDSDGDSCHNKITPVTPSTVPALPHSPPPPSMPLAQYFRVQTAWP